MNGLCEDCRYWQYKAFPLPGAAEGICSLHSTAQADDAKAAAFVAQRSSFQRAKGVFEDAPLATARDFGCVQFEAKS